MTNQSVLVLNTSYEVINICNVKRAILLIFKGIAVVEEKSENYIHTISEKFIIPSVIRLKTYIKVPIKKVVVSRKNVLIRDKYTCQYCGDDYAPEELTIDHIIPKSRGGSTKWDNVVACCKKCNNQKGHKTLRESGMKLIKKPSIPNYIFYLHIVRFVGTNIEKWKKYIFY